MTTKSTAQWLSSQPLDYQVIKEASPSHRPKFKVHLVTQEGYQATNPRKGGDPHYKYSFTSSFKRGGRDEEEDTQREKRDMEEFSQETSRSEQ